MQCVENFALHQFFAILGNSKIFSAMAMAMSIYRTLCVLVFATLGAVGNFLLHASMEQIRVFVAKSTLSRIHTFLVFIGPAVTPL